jgi:hypothetical protein
LNRALYFSGAVWYGAWGGPHDRNSAKGSAGGVLADIALGLARLGNGVVAFPSEPDVLIAIVERVVVVVRAAEGLQN